MILDTSILLSTIIIEWMIPISISLLRGQECHEQQTLETLSTRCDQYSWWKLFPINVSSELPWWLHQRSFAPYFIYVVIVSFIIMNITLYGSKVSFLSMNGWKIKLKGGDKAFVWDWNIHEWRVSRSFNYSPFIFWRMWYSSYLKIPFVLYCIVFTWQWRSI